MKLKLHPSTKHAFTAIDSSQGFTSLKHLYTYLKNNLGPIPIPNFAQLLKLSEKEALAFATQKGELNSEGNLVGLLGLSITPTNHKLVINHQDFYTWCAADTLIFPALLNVSAFIKSTDPINGEAIEIAIETDEITHISPAETYISWVAQVDENDIRCSMCNRVHFFSSEKTARQWHTTNQDARIFSVEKYYSTDLLLINT